MSQLRTATTDSAITLDAGPEPLVSAAWPTSGLLARIAAVPASAWLAGLVVVSALGRWIASLGLLSPYFFPDEYIHVEIARNVARHGRPLVRGASAHFPALLEPLLASPLWLVGGAETAYRLTQAMHAIAMSLAAVPVYLLCRRVGLGKWYSLGAGLVAVTYGDLFYSGIVTGTAIAYPLVLGAVYAGVCALDRPRLRTQAAFVVLAGLATLARVQFVVLFLAFAAAAIVLERLHPIRILRAWPLFWAVVALGATVGFGVGVNRTLGYYSDVQKLGVTSGGVGHWIAVDGMMFAFAAGAALVPAGVVGLVRAVVRPADRVEGAFGLFSVVLAVVVFLEAGMYAASGSTRFQERYLFALYPLLLPGVGLFVKRENGRLERLAVAALGLGLVLLVAEVPLSGYFQNNGKQDSPLLLAAFELSRYVGVGAASLAVSLAIAAALLVGMLPAISKRAVVAPLILVAVALGGAAVSLGATHEESLRTKDFNAQYFPNGDRTWVDAAHLGRVGWLQTGGDLSPMAESQFLWNSSLVDAYQLPKAFPFDAFPIEKVQVGAHGELLAGQGRVDPALVVPQDLVSTVWQNGTKLRGTDYMSLYRFDGTPRLAMLVTPRYLPGWLGANGLLQLWPRPGARSLDGELRVVLTVPAHSISAPMTFTAPGYRRHLVVVHGKTVVLRVPVHSSGPWTLSWKSHSGLYMPGVDWVSARATAIRFVPSPGTGAPVSAPSFK